MKQLHPFFRPRIAAVFVWLAFLAGLNIESGAANLDIDVLEYESIFWFAKAIDSLLSLYVWTTLWLILVQHFRFRSVHPFFYAILLVEIGNAALFTLSDWYPPADWIPTLRFVLYFGAFIAFAVKLLTMPQDLFGRKIHFAFTLIAWNLIQMVFNIWLLNTFYESFPQNPWFQGAFGLGLIFVRLFNLIVLTQIFLRAAKEGSPEDSLDHLIDNIGQGSS